MFSVYDDLLVFTYFRKLKDILTARIIKFLNDKSSKEPEEYGKFYADYHIFLKRGIISTQNQEATVKILFTWFF